MLGLGISVATHLAEGPELCRCCCSSRGWYNFPRALVRAVARYRVVLLCAGDQATRRGALVRVGKRDRERFLN